MFQKYAQTITRTGLHSDNTGLHSDNTGLHSDNTGPPCYDSAGAGIAVSGKEATDYGASAFFTVDFERGANTRGALAHHHHAVAVGPAAERLT